MNASAHDFVARAGSHFMAGEIDAAEALLEQATTLDPSHSRAWSDLGAVRFSLGNVGGANAALARALDIDPHHLDALLNLARLRSAEGRPGDAALLLRRAQAKNSDDPDVDSMLVSLGIDSDRTPCALLLDWKRSLRDRRPVLRSIMEIAGYRPRTVGRDVAEALAQTWDVDPSDAIARLLDALAPALVVTELDLDLAPSIAEAARTRNVPVLAIGDDGAVDPSLDADALASTVPQLLADLAPVTSRQTIEATPVISVIVPTFERPDCLRNLLDRLALQDLPPQLFEVIIVDDGSSEPVTSWLADQSPPFRLVLRWQENAGPARARNLAISEAQAKTLLILNDDAVPATDVLRRHLVGQATAERPEAILGTFDFGEDACTDPFTDLMQHSGLLFEYSSMVPGALHGGRFFWTCNLSVPRASVLAVGGFDEEFRHAICEDCELGYRLEAEDVMVRYDPRIRSWHDHDMSLPRYLKRARLLGRYRVRMFEKHPELVRALFRGDSGKLGEDAWLALRRKYEGRRDELDSLVARAEALLIEAEPHASASSERRRIFRELEPIIGELNVYESFRGMFDVRYGASLCEPSSSASLATEVTSVIIPNLNGFPHVKGCLGSFRQHTEDRHQLVVIDNGSTDGSLEWLRQQPDVTLLEMGENIGAPAARNAGLQVAKGATIVFSDNDVLFTPGWRSLLIRHLEAWPDIGVVGPMSDYVSGAQKTEEGEHKKESLDDFARRFTQAHAGEHLYTRRLILFFMMCTRELVEKIGGIDPIYGRWGFEDDDYCIRARIAGYELRIAKDCFIRHLGSRTAKTANLDYNQLLIDNFEVFKRKWGVDPNLRYGDPIDASEILRQPFDASKHYVPLSSGIPESANAG